RRRADRRLPRVLQRAGGHLRGRGASGAAGDAVVAGRQRLTQRLLRQGRRRIAVRPPAPSVATTSFPHPLRPKPNVPEAVTRTGLPPTVTLTELDAASARPCQSESSASMRSVKTFIVLGGTGYGGISKAYGVRQPYARPRRQRQFPQQPALGRAPLGATRVGAQERVVQAHERRRVVQVELGRPARLGPGPQRLAQQQPRAAVTSELGDGSQPGAA